MTPFMCGRGLRQTSLVICFINFLDERNLDVLSHVFSHQMGVLQIFFCRFVEGLGGWSSGHMGRSKGGEWPGHVRAALLIVLMQLSCFPAPVPGRGSSALSECHGTVIPMITNICKTHTASRSVPCIPELLHLLLMPALWVTVISPWWR